MNVVLKDFLFLRKKVKYTKMESRMKDQRISHIVSSGEVFWRNIILWKITWNWIYSSDEAPDTGDDSDEDLVTNYLGNGVVGSGNGNSNGTEHNLVPAIHITPQSPNGNHVLGEWKSDFHEIIFCFFISFANWGLNPFGNLTTTFWKNVLALFVKKFQDSTGRVNSLLCFLCTCQIRKERFHVIF